MQYVMRYSVVAMICICLLLAGCVEEQKEKDDSNKEPNFEVENEAAEFYGTWHLLKGSTELNTAIFEEDGNATVYFGCDCPGAKENAQWGIIDNYIDLAAESRTQRYVYILENETLYLRTVTENTFSEFIKRE